MRRVLPVALLMLVACGPGKESTRGLDSTANASPIDSSGLNTTVTPAPKPRSRSADDWDFTVQSRIAQWADTMLALGSDHLTGYPTVLTNNFLNTNSLDEPSHLTVALVNSPQGPYFAVFDFKDTVRFITSASASMSIEDPAPTKKGAFFPEPEVNYSTVEAAFGHMIIIVQRSGQLEYGPHAEEFELIELSGLVDGKICRCCHSRQDM